MCEVELIPSDEYVIIPEIKDNVVADDSTYSSAKIEQKLANASGNSLWYKLDGTEL